MYLIIWPPTVDMMKIRALLIMKLNFGNNFWLQEDNASVHKFAKVKNFMLQSSINILEWPAKSPDLNITEDIWKLISEQIYDGSQFLNINQLKTKLKNVIDDINRHQREKVLDLIKWDMLLHLSCSSDLGKSYFYLFRSLQTPCVLFKWRYKSAAYSISR